MFRFIEDTLTEGMFDLGIRLVEPTTRKTLATFFFTLVGLVAASSKSLLAASLQAMSVCFLEIYETHQSPHWV